jgi:hypothetical protein
LTEEREREPPLLSCGEEGTLPDRHSPQACPHVFSALNVEDTLAICCSELTVNLTPIGVFLNLNSLAEY